MPSLITKSITKTPYLNSLIDEFYSVSKGNYKTGVEKIRQIALLLSTVTDLLPTSPSLTGRINFLGKELLKESTRLEKFNYEDQINGLIVELHNYKNALQVEAVFYGCISKVFETYQEWSQEPVLTEFWANLPTIFEHVFFDCESKKYSFFKLDLSLLEKTFSSLELDKLPVSFDQIISTMFCLYEIQDNCLIIPADAIPSIEILAYWIESPDSYIKLVGQIFLFCKFDTLLITSCMQGKFTTEKILSSFEEKLFIHYLKTKKELIPLFTHLLKYTIDAKDDHKALTNILVNKDFLNEDKRLKGSDWLEEAANVYSLIRKLELGLKKIFPIDSPLLKRTNAYLLKSSCDPKIFIFSEFCHSIADCSLKYPITPDHPFVVDEESFKMLNPYYYLIANNKENKGTAKDLKPIKIIKEKKKTKSDRSLKSAAIVSTSTVSEVAATGGAGTGGAGTSSFTSTPLIKDDDDLNLSSLLTLFKLKKSTPTIKEEKSCPKVDFLLASIMETQKLLKKISIHKRVAVWWESSDIGLAYYKYGKDDKIHHLTKDEMILSHQLPQKLLLLLLNPHFGIKKTITLKTGEVISKHYEASISINKERYIIEASINEEKNQLFHYYARRIKRVEDLKISSDSTLSTLESTEISTEGWSEISLSSLGFSFDKEGNVSYSEDDKIYFIPRLQHPWLAKA